MPRQRPGREDTWINPQIERLFGELKSLGYAHSVESWQDGSLVGGLYGVAIGGVFFGESMFSKARDASKVALVHLVARLRLGGFRLLDTQFVTAHLSQFGAEELPREEYKERLADCARGAGSALPWNPIPLSWRRRSVPWRAAEGASTPTMRIAAATPHMSLCNDRLTSRDP